MAKSAPRTTIPEDWTPDEAGKEYADARGVPGTEIEAFRDYHLARGNLMASWPAAWRTWCQNAVKFGTATGRRAETNLAIVLPFTGPDDPWGIITWQHQLRDAIPDKIGDRAIMTLGGHDVAETAREACKAAAIPEDSRPDLEPIARWLRAGYTPETISEAIVMSGTRPSRPTLAYYDRRVQNIGKKRGRAA